MSEDTNDESAGPPKGWAPDSGHDLGGALRDANGEQPLEGRRERSDQPRGHLRRESGKTERRHCRRGRRS